jgi:hypothetical protein
MVGINTGLISQACIPFGVSTTPYFSPLSSLYIALSLKKASR